MEKNQDYSQIFSFAYASCFLSLHLNLRGDATSQWTKKKSLNFFSKRTCLGLFPFFTGLCVVIVHISKRKNSWCKRKQSVRPCLFLIQQWRIYPFAGKCHPQRRATIVRKILLTEWTKIIDNCGLSWTVKWLSWIFLEVAINFKNEVNSVSCRRDLLGCKAWPTNKSTKEMSIHLGTSFLTVCRCTVCLPTGYPYRLLIFPATSQRVKQVVRTSRATQKSSSIWGETSRPSFPQRSSDALTFRHRDSRARLHSSLKPSSIHKKYLPEWREVSMTASILSNKCFGHPGRLFRRLD